MVEVGRPLELREVPIPAVGDEDVLVRVARAGFNGGDPHLVTGDVRVSPEFMPRVRLPLTIGHDGAGIVAEVGGRVQGLSVGDRVFVKPDMECGHCLFCRTGRDYLCENDVLRGWLSYTDDTRYDRYKDGFCAEYALAHHWQVHRLPDSVPFGIAGHLHIVGVGYMAPKLAQVGHGDVVAITGATGCTGAAAALASRVFNPKKIVVIARQRARLEKLRAVDPSLIDFIALDEEDLSSRLLELTEGRGIDVLLDFIPRGSETTQKVLYRMRRGGRVILAGGNTEDITISYRHLMRTALTLHSYRGFFNHDVPVLLDLILSGKLDLSCIAIRTRPLEQANEALRLVMERPGHELMWVQVLPNPGVE